MSSWVPPTHSLTRDVLAVWAKNVEKATGGRVKFEMLPKHPSAPPGTFDAVRDGLVDVSFVTASYTPARHPLPLMAELPGAGATAEINSVAFSRIHWKYFQQANEYKGVKLLGVFDARAGPDVHQEAGDLGRRPGRHEDPHRRRHRRSRRPSARRLAVRQAGARVVRAALLRGRRRHVLPVRVDRLVQARQGRQVRDLLPGRLLFLVVRLLHERGQVEQAAEAGPGRDPRRSRARRSRGSPASRGMRADKRRLRGAEGRERPVIDASPAFVADVRKRTEPLVQDWIKSANAKGVDGAKAWAEYQDELKKVAAGK